MTTTPADGNGGPGTPRAEGMLRAANLISEIIGTFVLVVGLLVLAIGLSLGGPTGYAINPARDLGPRIARAVLPIAGKGTSDWAYSWIPVVGPLTGGAIGAVAYTALFTNALGI